MYTTLVSPFRLVRTKHSHRPAAWGKRHVLPSHPCRSSVRDYKGVLDTSMASPARDCHVPRMTEEPRLARRVAICRSPTAAISVSSTPRSHAPEPLVIGPECSSRIRSGYLRFGAVHNANRRPAKAALRFFWSSRNPCICWRQPVVPRKGSTVPQYRIEFPYRSLNLSVSDVRCHPANVPVAVRWPRANDLLVSRKSRVSALMLESSPPVF